MYQKSYWRNVIHAYLTDEAKKIGLPSITISVSDLSAKVNCQHRTQVARTLKELKKEGLIDIEWRIDESGGSAPSTYTVLPLEADKLWKIEQLATLLSIRKGEAMRAIHRLMRTPYDANDITLADLANIAGYTGSPNALANALIIVGFIGRDGRVGW